jgi:hypothetical protein
MNSVTRLSAIVIVWFTLAFVCYSQEGLRIDTVVIYKPFPPIPESRGSYIPQVKISQLMVIDLAHLDAVPHPILGPLAPPDSIAYPDLCIRAGVEGIVLLKVDLDERGLPIHVRCLWTDFEIFVNVAEQAVLKTTFKPASSGGSPVRVTGLIQIIFTLNKKAHSLDWLHTVASEISLARTPSMGGGQEYTVTLRRNGIASYKGVTSVDKVGLYQGHCDSASYSRLEKLLGWFSFFDKTINRGNANCVAYDIVTAVCDGRSISVGTDGGDERIWALARIIDQVAETIRWTKVK